MTGPPDRRIVTGLRSVDTKIRPATHFPGVSIGQFTGVIVPKEVSAERGEMKAPEEPGHKLFRVHALRRGFGSTGWLRYCGLCISLPLLLHTLAGRCRCGGLRGCCLRTRNLLHLHLLHLPWRSGRLLLDCLGLVAFGHRPRILRGSYFGHRPLLGSRPGVDFKAQVLHFRHFLTRSDDRRGLNDGTELPRCFRRYLAGRFWFKCRGRG